jgi:hypothetical protein
MHSAQRDRWRVLLEICLVLALVAPALPVGPVLAEGGGLTVSIKPGFPDTIPADGKSTVDFVVSLDLNSKCGKALGERLVGGGGKLSVSVSALGGKATGIASFDELGENTLTFTADQSSQDRTGIVTVMLSLIPAESVDVMGVSSDPSSAGVSCRGDGYVALTGSSDQPAEEPQPPAPADQPQAPEPPQPEVKPEEPPPPPEVKPDASQPEVPVVQPPPPATQGKKMKRDLIRTILAAVQQGKGPQDLPNWDKLSDRQKSKVTQVFNLALIMYLSAKPVKK